MLCSYDNLLLQQGQPFTNICHSCTHNLSHSLDFYLLNVIHTHAHSLKDKPTHTLRVFITAVIQLFLCLRYERHTHLGKTSKTNI